jgi:hypothetical protein
MERDIIFSLILLRLRREERSLLRGVRGIPIFIGIKPLEYNIPPYNV